MKSKCTRCDKVKLIEEFYWRDKKRKIPTTYCKVCCKLTVKKWRKNEGRDKWIASRNSKIERVRKWVNEQRALGCEKCSESRYHVIDFHHKDPSEKEFTLGNQSHYSSWKAIKREIKKCIRLCANCHRDFHFQEKENNINIVEYLEL